jgi:glycosyltransferase involved in cell wall biosynthesis
MMYKGTILLVTYSDYPWYSGLSRRIEGLSSALKKSGINVDIMSPIYYMKEEMKRPDVKYVNLRWARRTRREVGFSRILAKLTRMFARMLFSLLCLIEALRHGRNVVVQYEHLDMFPVAMLAKVLVGARIVGDDINLLFPRYKHVLIRKVLYVIERHLIENTDVIVTASSITYKFITENFPGKPILFVPNGVFIKKLFMKKHEKLLLFVGSLNFAQNLSAINNIMWMAQELWKKRKDFRIIIVGGPLCNVEGLLGHELVREGAVKFLGFTPEKVLKSLYKRALVGLLPYFEETPRWGGQMTKALEYLAHGLLVVSGPHGIRGISGLEPKLHYVSAKSPKEMLRVLQRCLIDPKKHDHIRAHGTAFIANNYSWDVVTENYVKVVKKLIES